MKITNVRRVILASAMLLSSALSLGQASAADYQSRYDESANPLLVRPSSGGRLVIRRIANLGNGVAISVWLDGTPLGVIGYGHAYDGFLPAGHHVLSVTVNRPTWPGYESQTILNVRNGETYAFTATGDHSGHLILEPTVGPWVPNGYSGRAVSY